MVACKCYTNTRRVKKEKWLRLRVKTAAIRKISPFLLVFVTVLEALVAMETAYSFATSTQTLSFCFVRFASECKVGCHDDQVIQSTLGNRRVSLKLLPCSLRAADSKRSRNVEQQDAQGEGVSVSHARQQHDPQTKVGSE